MLALQATPTFSQQAKLTASDGDNNDFFGISVAIDGDTAVAGAPLDNNARRVKPRRGLCLYAQWDDLDRATETHGQGRRSQ